MEAKQNNYGNTQQMMENLIINNNGDILFKGKQIKPPEIEVDVDKEKLRKVN